MLIERFCVFSSYFISFSTFIPSIFTNRTNLTKQIHCYFHTKYSISIKEFESGALKILDHELLKISLGGVFFNF